MLTYDNYNLIVGKNNNNKVEGEQDRRPVIEPDLNTGKSDKLSQEQQQSNFKTL